MRLFSNNCLYIYGCFHPGLVPHEAGSPIKVAFSPGSCYTQIIPLVWNPCEPTGQPPTKPPQYSGYKGGYLIQSLPQILYRKLKCKLLKREIKKHCFIKITFINKNKINTISHNYKSDSSSLVIIHAGEKSTLGNEKKLSSGAAHTSIYCLSCCYSSGFTQSVWDLELQTLQVSHYFNQIWQILRPTCHQILLIQALQTKYLVHLPVSHHTDQ